MTRTYFVTGTDTEIGKTASSCAILHAANRRGLATAAVKPVAAGCDEDGRNEDAVQLIDAMSETLDYDEVNPVALQEAIAPHLAAVHEGRELQSAALAGKCRAVAAGRADLVLVEGAGGWRVPINASETLADVARQLQAPVLLVVGMRLGCINHALLSAQAIAADGLTLAGWVANTIDPAMNCFEENLQTLHEWLPAPCLGTIPHLSPWSAENAAKFVEIDAIM